MFFSFQPFSPSPYGEFVDGEQRRRRRETMGMRLYCVVDGGVFLLLFFLSF